MAVSIRTFTKEMKMTTLTTLLDHLGQRIARGEVGEAEPWGGADVVVCEVAPAPTEDGFYPDPRYVETSYVPQVSWMFEQVRNIFWDHDGYGGWKEELFGRLGNVVQAQTSRSKDVTRPQILAALLHEAYAMAEEVEDFGGLETMMLSWDNHILDDFTNSSSESGMLSLEESDAFLRSLVVE